MSLVVSRCCAVQGIYIISLDGSRLHEGVDTRGRYRGESIWRETSREHIQGESIYEGGGSRYREGVDTRWEQIQGGIKSKERYREV